VVLTVVLEMLTCYERSSTDSGTSNAAAVVRAAWATISSTDSGTDSGTDRGTRDAAML
jgi:hypothetical protein